MWHAETGDQTFTGPFGIALAYGIKEIVERLDLCFEDGEDDHDFGCKVFSRMTLEQKTWALHQVAFGLLDPDTPIVELTAYNESTVGSIFYVLVDLVTMEIDHARENDMTDPEWWEWSHHVRRAIFTLREREGRNVVLLHDDEEVLSVECTDLKLWRMAIEEMEETILWDLDYQDDRMIEIDPDKEAEWKETMGIADEYYTAIPEDPSRKNAHKLLKKVERLCDKIIEVEEKKLIEEIMP